MYEIDKKLCSSCGLCIDICPFEAISQFRVYEIKKDICKSCGICQESCPSNAIKQIHTIIPLDK